MSPFEFVQFNLWNSSNQSLPAIENISSPFDFNISDNFGDSFAIEVKINQTQEIRNILITTVVGGQSITQYEEN